MARRSVLDLDATAQLALLASRQVGAVELLKAALARHEQTHKALNAVVAADLPRALERARAIDEQRVKGEHLGPLAGLPITIKDTFDVVGMPASSGLAALRQRTAGDATAVGHVRRAGAVIWGKTNTPVMAGDWQTANSLYGVTNNPWDPTRTPGGSSGGAAAALAAGVTALEIASDIGGSLRVPASFCGVFAHKPTWGMVTQHGHVPPVPGSWAERDLNVVGPMPVGPRPAPAALGDRGRAAGPQGPARQAGRRPLRPVARRPQLSLDPQVRAIIEAFARDLEAAGAVVEPIASPVDSEALLEAYVTLLGAVVGEDLPEGQMRQFELMRGPAGLMRQAGGPLSTASLIRAYTATHREWLAADAVRMRLRHELADVFGRFDAVLAPAAPVPAFPHDRRGVTARKLALSDGSSAPYMALMCWMGLATACLLPATAIPAGRTAQGLPVGVQIIGPHAGDGRTLALAQAIDEDIRGFEPPPEAQA